jgi:hypothetical protein
VIWDFTGIDFGSDFLMYLAMAENDINVIYLGGNDANTYGPLIFKSVNGGDSWTKIFKTEGNENIITAWEGYGGDKNWSWSETVFGLEVAPGNSDKVLFGNYSNIESTTDGGITWKQAYVSNADQHLERPEQSGDELLEHGCCDRSHRCDAEYMVFFCL